MSTPMRPDDATSTEDLLAAVRARQLAQETLAHDRFTFGPTSPRITPTLERVGRIELELGHDDAARESYQQVLEIDQVAMGPDHPATQQCKQELEKIERAAQQDGADPV